MAKAVTKRLIKTNQEWKLTEDTVKKLEEAFSIDASIEEACFYANISKQTYYNWVEKYPDYKDRFDALRQKPILKARQEVVKGLTNYQNAMDYLKRKRKDEFSERLEQTGKDGEPLGIILYPQSDGHPMEAAS